MARKKQSHDQKRKKKLAQRRKKAASGITPYEGEKYRGERYVPFLFEAERAIHESDLVAGQALNDQQVRESLEYLVRQLRGEKPPLPAGHLLAEDEEGRSEDLVTAQIRIHWDEVLPEIDYHPSHADLAGVLRTILDSLNTRTHMTPGGRGYLDYLPEFLAQAGVDTVTYPVEEEELGEGEGLFELGEAWVVDGDPGARHEFLTLARQYIADGDAGLVDETISSLLPAARDHHLRESLARVRQELRGSSWCMAGRSEA